MALTNSFKNYFSKKEEKKREEKKTAWQIISIPMKWDSIKFIHGAVQDIMSNCMIPEPEIGNCMEILKYLGEKEKEVYETSKLEIPANMITGLWHVLNHGRAMGVYTKSPLDRMMEEKGTESQKLEVIDKLIKKRKLDARLDTETMYIAAALDSYHSHKNKNVKKEDIVKALPKTEIPKQLT